MSNKIRVLIGFVIMTTISMSGSVLADDFQEVLKQSNNCETTGSISSENINTTDTWSINGKVKQYQHEVEEKNNKHKQAIAIMDKPALNTWRDNLGNPIKL